MRIFAPLVNAGAVPARTPCGYRLGTVRKL